MKPEAAQCAQPFPDLYLPLWPEAFPFQWQEAHSNFICWNKYLWIWRQVLLEFIGRPPLETIPVISYPNYTTRRLLLIIFEVTRLNLLAYMIISSNFYLGNWLSCLFGISSQTVFELIQWISSKNQYLLYLWWLLHPFSI